MERVKAKIRDIPDFPKPGIVFKDLTPVFADPLAMRRVIDALTEPFHDQNITMVAGMEARGFILGPLVAHALTVGFVPLRKPGKLPSSTFRVSYDLEYGATALEIHRDAVGKGDRVLLVDDLIATGGTAQASRELVAKTTAEVVACAFVIELDFLQGRQVLDTLPVHSLIHF